MALDANDLRKVGFYWSVDQIVDAIEGGGYTLPAATTTVLGGVKQAAAVANQSALTVSGADAAAVATSATTAVQALTTKLNAALAALRTAGIMAP